MDYEGDPYRLGNADDMLREAFKTSALILLNSPSEKRAVKAIRMKFLEKGIPLLKDAEIKDLIRQLENHHSSISEFFCSDKGVEFMNLDARIMDGILTYFADKGTPVLPVHDSCIAPRHLELHLREVMREEYKKVTGFEPVIDKKF